jgi:predicted MFS family arabinose efflux permease
VTAPLRHTDIHSAGAGITLLMAVAAGLAVANVYYAQPLIDAIGADLGLNEAVLGFVMMSTQVGYGLGLICVAPLGDLFDRRQLISAMSAGLCLALSVVFVAGHPAVFLIGMASVGVLAVVAQVIVAHAASLAAPNQRGRIVGTVTSGIVVGILLARTVSGSLSDLFGWRSVYAASAMAELGAAILLLRLLPTQPSRQVCVTYAALIRSFWKLFAEVPILRTRGILAFFTFFAVTTLLTPLVLPLTAPPFSYSHTVVGLFGFAGVAGAMGAVSAGRLADRGYAQLVSGVALGIMVLSWGSAVLLPQSIWFLVIAVIAMDYGLQAVHVTNQSLIYRVRSDAQSSLAAAYMIFYAAGSGAGSVSSTIAYATGGWEAVCILGATVSSAGWVFWAWTRTDTSAPSR